MAKDGHHVAKMCFTCELWKPDKQYPGRGVCGAEVAGADIMRVCKLFCFATPEVIELRHQALSEACKRWAERKARKGTKP